MALIGIPTVGASGYLPALLTELAEPVLPAVLLVCNGSAGDVAAVQARVAAARRVPRLSTRWHPDRNIYGSWNTIMDEADAGGHRVAVILNDDVFIDSWSIKAAELAITRDGYTIVGWDPDVAPEYRPGARVVVPVSGSYREHGVTGFAFAIDVRAGIRCDERFGWWGGDDDLVYTITARSLTAGKMLGVGVRHWPSTSSSARPEVLATLEADRALLLAKWQRSW